MKPVNVCRALAAAVSISAWTGRSATCTYTDGTWDTQPGENDDIVISSGDLTWGDSLPVKVGSWTQGADYTGTVTFDTGLETFTVTGDVTLAGGTWTHTENPGFTPTSEAWTSGRGTKQLIVSVGGDMTIAAAAKIDVTGRGFTNGDGPGSSSLITSGGSSHGGSGSGTSRSRFTLPCYGSARCPVTIGSGGRGGGYYGSSGGGAVRLTVAGTMSHDGLIASMGGLYKTGTSVLNDYYAASGGSVWITARGIEGEGKINADGGDVTNYAEGGGGRIAVYLTGENASFENCRWEMTAYSGRHKTYGASFPGTVYLETAADDGKGVLICRDRDRPISSIWSYANDNFGTGLAESEEFGEIRISGRTYVRIPSNVTIKVGKVVCENEAGDGSFGIASAGVWTNKIVLAGGTLELPLNHVLSNYTLVVQTPASVLRIGEGEGNCGDLVIRDGGELQINTPVVWTRNILVGKGGIISHIYGATTKKKLDLTLEGDLTVEEGGAIDVSGRGYPYQTGPGTGTTTQCGTSHGGRGHLGSNNYGHTNGECYGSITSPVDCGSGGRYGSTDFQSAGGGSAKVTVAGVFTLDGVFAANGARDDHHTGAGGSAWIIARELTGAGVISANGGNARNNTGVGGGGRVAVWLTGEDSTFDDFTGEITAYGGCRGSGKPLAAPGSVYLKTAAQDEHGGRLVIDNGPGEKAVVNTQISPAVTDAWVGEVFIASNACVEIMSNQTFRFSRGWCNEGRLVCADTSSVECVPGSDDVLIEGTNAFYSFSCTFPGATLLFSPVASLFSISPGGKLTLKGDEESPLELASAVDSQSWLLDVDPSALVEAEFLDVADSDASKGALVVAKNSQAARCENWSVVNVTAGETIVWTGEAGNGLWSDASNWNLERAPVETDHVEVPPGCTSFPKLVEDFACLSVSLAHGASLDLAGCDLAVNALTNAGNLVARSFEKISVAGDFVFTASASFIPAYSEVSVRPAADAVFKGAGLRFRRIVIRLSGGSLLFDGDVDVREFSVTASAPSVMTVSPGSEIKTVSAELDGLVDGAVSLSLASSSPATAWKLSVRDSAIVTGVAVSDCDASQGVAIAAEDPSQDAGRNVNWNFSRVVAKWTGAAGSGFFDEANWSTGEVPGEGDIVVIDAAADIVLTEEVTVSELRLGGGEEAVSLTVSSPLAVSGTMSVFTNAVVVMNAPTSIGGSLLVGEGAVLTHSKNDASELYKINLEVGGNAHIAEGGRIDVKGRGYAKGKGPGAVGVNLSGGSHGGRGCGTDFRSFAPSCYGSVFCPTNCGSSGSWDSSFGAAGGGAVRMTVEGELSVDGRIDAEGGDDIVRQEANSIYYCYYSGAGGSIWLTAGSLGGYGLVTANGGLDGHACCGGGGRIAVYLTKSDDPADTLSITCYGGRRYSTLDVTYPAAAPGSIYLQGCGENDAAGRIIFDNGTASAGCLSKPTATTCDFPATNLSERAELYRNAKLVVGPGAPVKITVEEKMRVKDVELHKGGILSVIDNVLWISSLLHRDGRGWEGTLKRYDADEDGVYGEVRWLAPGLFLIVR